MDELKLNRINQGESQETFSDKINQNFSDVQDFFGGPYGRNGEIGYPGKMGPIGPLGSKGLRGERGSLWFLDPLEPSDALDGDYWVNIADLNKVYLLSDSVWVYQNFNLKADEQFKRLSGVEGPDFKDALVQSSSNPSTNTFVLNSSTPDADKLNPQYSRVVLETSPGSSTDFDQLTQPLLEFSKAGGGTGSYDKSPIFEWGEDSVSNNTYDLSWSIRRGGIKFEIGGNLKLNSNSGKVILESQSGSADIFVGGMEINTTGDVIMTDLEGSGNNTLRITSSNFSTGIGLFDDSSSLASPINVSTVTEGYDKQSLSVENYLDTRGGGIGITVNKNSGSGNLWNSKLGSTNYLRLDQKGEMKISRKTGIRRDQTNQSTETHGAYNSITYNWHAIYPSTATGESLFGRIDWDGEEDIIVTTNFSIINRALYVNVSELSEYYMGIDKCISFSVKTSSESQGFTAVGIGGGTGASNYYPRPGNEGEWDNIRGSAFVIDFHLVNYKKDITRIAFGEDPEEAIDYGLYYEAYGLTGGIQTGVLEI